MFYIVITNWLHHLHQIQSSNKVNQLSSQAKYNYKKKFSYMKRCKRRISLWKRNNPNSVSIWMFFHVYRWWMHFIRTMLANRGATCRSATSDLNWNKQQNLSDAVEFNMQRKSIFLGPAGRSPPEGEPSVTAGCLVALTFGSVKVFDIRSLAPENTGKQNSDGIPGCVWAFLEQLRPEQDQYAIPFPG